MISFSLLTVRKERSGDDDCGRCTPFRFSVCSVSADRFFADPIGPAPAVRSIGLTKVPSTQDSVLITHVGSFQIRNSLRRAQSSAWDRVIDGCFTVPLGAVFSVRFRFDCTSDPANPAAQSRKVDRSSMRAYEIQNDEIDLIYYASMKQ